MAGSPLQRGLRVGQRRGSLGGSLSDHDARLSSRTAFLRSRPRMLLPVQSLVCLAAFGLALPLAISLFPQMSQVSGTLLPVPGGGVLWKGPRAPLSPLGRQSGGPGRPEPACSRAPAQSTRGQGALTHISRCLSQGTKGCFRGWVGPSRSPRVRPLLARGRGAACSLWGRDGEGKLFSLLPPSTPPLSPLSRPSEESQALRHWQPLVPTWQVWPLLARGLPWGGHPFMGAGFHCK